MNKPLLFLFLSVLLLVASQKNTEAQPKEHTPAKDYCKQFPEGCAFAESFLKEKALLFKKIAKEYQLNENQMKEVLAIGYPELTRYGSGQKLLEEGLLKGKKSGLKMPDISVGAFQIKKSFAEKLFSQKIPTQFLPLSEKWNQAEESYDLLLQPEFSFRLLCLFYVLNSNTFTQENYRLELLAAYYNGMGLMKDYSPSSKRYTFPFGKEFKGKQYNYPELSRYFYIHFKYI